MYSLAGQFKAACMSYAAPFSMASILGVSPTADVVALPPHLEGIKVALESDAPDDITLEALAAAVKELESLYQVRTEAQSEDRKY